ncbi:MAG TPA: flagellar basal body-associated FliL family protein [Chloroflexota bacterium]
MIRANDSGLANAPAAVVDDMPPRRGLLTVRNMIILGALAWIALLALFVLPRVTSKPAQPEASTGAVAKPAVAAESVNTTGGAAGPTALPGPQLTIANRVFNLAGASAGFKYVKLTVAVQFDDQGGQFAKAKGDALKKLQDSFAADNAGALGAFNDIMTTSVGTRSAADLAKPEGKEQLRSELISKFNNALRAGGSREHVRYVIFSDFVMQ